MKTNVIVLMFDSLQHNYLGCYGNKWIKTPNMDRLAREGILFENNYIDNLPTVPCRRSMHTGRYSLQFEGWSPLRMEETTIADLCWGRPIDTALIFDCPMYRLPKFGYTRSFDKVHFIHGQESDESYYRTDTLYHRDVMDYFEDHVIEAARKRLGDNWVEATLEETRSYLKGRQYWKTDADQNVAQVMKQAVHYLENADRSKQFYLWIDCFDPHEPWDSPSVYGPDLKCAYDPDYKGKDMFNPIMGPVEGIYTEPEMNHIRMLYAENVTMVDKWLGYLMDKIRALGLEENTLLLMLSDHGEPMGNGEHGHGIMRKSRPWPYEELAHAPMLMRGPGLPAGKRVKGFTQSCDIAPTVTDWLGMGVHPDMQGRSLLPLAKGEVDKIRDFAIAGYHKYSMSIITDDWSFIHWRAPEERTVGTGVEVIIGQELAKTCRHLGFGKELDKMVETGSSTKHTADGEDQWTCTPGSTAEVPQGDELYDRQADQFQLNNLATQKPERASELFATLRDFMAELRTT